MPGYKKINLATHQPKSVGKNMLSFDGIPLPWSTNIRLPKSRLT
jgi:hypothetical protein